MVWMRAIRVARLDGPHAAELAEVDEPTGDGVVIDVHAAGVAFPDALHAAADEHDGKVVNHGTQGSVEAEQDDGYNE